MINKKSRSFLRTMTSLVLSLALLCAFAMPTLGESAAVADGTYTGSGKGMHSNIEVGVTVEGGKITKVEILEQDETPGISDPAFTGIPEAIVAAQSTEVDVIAGATLTSNGIIEAVNAALSGTEGGETEATITPDVIVVGSGMAGLSAAVRSVELGLNVLILEASVRTGGCMYNAGGTISGAGFKIQRENGVEDTPEAYFADILALGGEGEFNVELAKTHTERSGEAIDWLDEDLQVDFGDRGLVAGAYTAMDTLRVTRALGLYSMGAAQAFMEPLNARLEQYIADGKAQILFNTEVTEVLVEGDQCIGVKAGDKEYLAKSVVLATGGYCYNEELLKMAGFENVISQAPMTSNGSGFYLAQAVGGVFDNMDKIVTFYGGGIPTNGFDMYYQLNAAFPGFIYVNTSGQRVANEESNNIMMWKDAPENKLYAVVAGNMITEETQLLNPGISKRATMNLTNKGWDKLEELAAEGNCVFKADTLEELAEKIGAADLVATVAKYNEDVAAGEDSVFGRSQERMVAFEEGPYYAVLTVPYVWSGTSGGVRANGQGYLEKEDGTIIEGLSLAGEILGPTNILGLINFGGINHSMCATWGMIAAENAAARAEE